MYRRLIILIVLNKRLSVMLAAAAIAGMLGYYAGSASITTMGPLRDSVAGRKVVIDPGHGGRDSGARGRSTGIPEKDINLHIATELKTLLNRAAVHVVMTREGDYDLLEGATNVTGSRKRAELMKRVEFINKSNADILVSIHSNSFPEPQWSGAQVFYVAESVQGRHLAASIQSELVARLGPNTRKEKPADIYILRRASMPAALVEVGFLSNPREERLLSDPEYRRRVAQAVYHGIVRYFTTPARSAPAVASRDILPSATPSSTSPDDVVLYFGGPTNFDDCLLPELRTIDGFSQMTRSMQVSTVINQLINGPGYNSILQPTLPKTVVLRGVSINGDTVCLDFSEEFVSAHWGGSRAEELTIYSIVNTLTELSFVKRVLILVDGQAVQTLAGHVSLEGPLERNLSIIQCSP